MRPYRLTVRTPGFHPGNPGSIPGKVTIMESRGSLESFFVCPSICRIYSKSVKHSQTVRSKIEIHYDVDI